MKVIGIDGGGSKTEYLFFDTDCGYRIKKRFGTIDIHLTGLEEFRNRINTGLECLLEESRTNKAEIAMIAIGMPCYGENQGEEELVDETLDDILCDYKKHAVYNDVFFSTYGALGGNSGICMLSGTGSMAFGISDDGHCARSGGWSRYYSDDGSAFWLGAKAMNLFTKEADGIIPKGPLYDIVMEEYSLSKPFDFISIGDKLYEGRSGCAKFQMLLRRAADFGDANARAIYDEAIMELANQIRCIKQRFDSLNYEVSVFTTAGGLLDNDPYLCDGIQKELLRDDVRMVPPILSSSEGAVLFSERFINGSLPEYLTNKLIFV